VIATPAHEIATSTTPTSARSRATARRTPGASSIDGFARARAHLGFDNPGWCAPRRAAVLSTLEASSRLTPSQLRTMVRTQQPRLTIRDHADMLRRVEALTQHPQIPVARCGLAAQAREQVS
jgi:hypothetical protein